MSLPRREEVIELLKNEGYRSSEQGNATPLIDSVSVLLYMHDPEPSLDDYDAWLAWEKREEQRKGITELIDELMGD